MNTTANAVVIEQSMKSLQNNSIGIHKISSLKQLKQLENFEKENTSQLTL
jgi:hypothetical protein